MIASVMFEANIVPCAVIYYYCGDSAQPSVDCASDSVFDSVSGTYNINKVSIL